MKRLLVLVLVVAGASLSLSAQGARGWTTLFDGKNLDAFNKVGDRQLDDRRGRRAGQQRDGAGTSLRSSRTATSRIKAEVLGGHAGQ